MNGNKNAPEGNKKKSWGSNPDAGQCGPCYPLVNSVIQGPGFFNLPRWAVEHASCVLVIWYLFCTEIFFSQIMDDRWESEVVEYGAINITGFRIVDTSRKYVKDFLEAWKRLDKLKYPGAGEFAISGEISSA